MARRKASARARQKAAKKTQLQRQPKPKKQTSRSRIQQKKLTLKRKRKRAGIKQLKANPDFRERTNFPLPPVEEIEQRLRSVLNPGSFATRRLKKQTDQQGKLIKLRDRILTLPVMAVLVVSLVWRQIPSLSEALRVIAREGLWDFAAFTVSKQALSKRLRVLPAELFAQMYEEALEALRESSARQVQPEPPAELSALPERFSALWLADGSTLEALRRKLKELRATKTPLAGKILSVVDALTRRPVRTWYTTEAQANDKTFCQQVLDALPVGGLLGLDAGWFSFPFFDELTEAGKFFVTRWRAKTAYRVVEVLALGSHCRDEIIEVGQYRSNPCRHRLRRVSILWGTTWYHYLTNVLDPQKLSAREVCAFYRRRWRVEEAFLLTKRLLGLSYLWVGDRNGVEIQLYATWLFYAVLSDLCVQVAVALMEPLEKISVELVFRSFYHFARAIEMGENPVLIPFLVQNAKLFGLVKAERKRHKEKEMVLLEIWGTS
jgi:DDE family transposase